MIYGEKNLTDNTGTPVLKAYFSKLPATKRDFRKHHHAECELSVFLQGNGTYSTDEVHCVTEILSDFKLLNLRFMPNLLLSDGGNLNFLKILFSRNEKFENLIDPHNHATEIIRNNICSIEKELSEKLDGYDTMVRYLLFSIFTNLIRNYDYVTNQDPCFEYKNSIGAIGKALKFIDDNINKPITLSEISSVAAMSPTYFSTVFKKINGLSPWRYITIKRVEKAVELLKTTELSKLDIAAECGFSGSSNFYKSFKAITGKQPKDFAKKH